LDFLLDSSAVEAATVAEEAAARTEILGEEEKRAVLLLQVKGNAPTAMTGVDDGVERRGTETRRATAAAECFF